MADTKISDLAAVTDVLATDEYVLARAGTTKKIDASDLAVGIAASAGFGTALPGSPTDGVEFILTDSTTAPTYTWRFRYVSAKSSNKWVFIGGPRIMAQTNETPESTASTSYTDLSTGGPAVALPVTGDYQVEIGFTGDGGVGTGACMSYAIGGTAAVDADRAIVSTDSGNERLNGYRLKFKAGLGAVTLTAKYRNADTAGTVRFYSRFIAVTPVAIGG